MLNFVLSSRKIVPTKVNERNLLMGTGILTTTPVYFQLTQSGVDLLLIYAQNTMETHSTSETNVFEQLDTYPWKSDAEFQTGLRAILGSNPSQEQAGYLTLRAQCFYYSRYVASSYFYFR